MANDLEKSQLPDSKAQRNPQGPRGWSALPSTRLSGLRASRSTSEIRIRTITDMSSLAAQQGIPFVTYWVTLSI
jgi:hypothetical protein